MAEKACDQRAVDAGTLSLAMKKRQGWAERRVEVLHDACHQEVEFGRFQAEGFSQDLQRSSERTGELLLDAADRFLPEPAGALHLPPSFEFRIVGIFEKPG